MKTITAPCTITTTYKGPGNVRGSRIVASNDRGRYIMSYDHALSSAENHAQAATIAAMRLCPELKGAGEFKIYSAFLKNGVYNHVFVTV